MKVTNRNFHREYEAVDTYEAGISLVGAEVKSIKQGNIKLENAFAKISENGEVYLTNAEIPIYRFAVPQGYEPTRRRKLLLHKKEIIKLQTKLQSGGRLTIIPIACYTKGRHIKISIALARAKGEIAKKKLERSEDIKREQEREMKEYIKK
ncbi:SsrA-binding protein SmpB [Candidatus Roizmanbacteria bacterium]|nr:MAG: SsrA-binding protein SmpB [Candidatus Roizmanbacteria bacterium]